MIITLVTLTISYNDDSPGQLSIGLLVLWFSCLGPAATPLSGCLLTIVSYLLHHSHLCLQYTVVPHGWQRW